MVITMVNFKIFKKKETIQQELQLFSLFSSFVRQSLVTPLANGVFKPNECCRSFGVLVESQQKDTWNSISCSFPQTSEHFAYKTKKNEANPPNENQTDSIQKADHLREACMYLWQKANNAMHFTNKQMPLEYEMKRMPLSNKKKRGEQREILKKTYGLG